MNFKSLLQQKKVKPYILSARFGLEKESQRSKIDGRLATTEHPKVLGNRSYHPYIQTDFSETQIELITPVADSIDEVSRYLSAIQEVAYRSLEKEEILWPLSMPPKLPEKDEEIKIAKLDDFEETLYRQYLAKKYGKRKQMISGIHFNFEYSIDLIQHMFNEQSEFEKIEEFKNTLYMKTARNYLRYRWLITYLFGASPVCEKGYFTEQDKSLNEPVRSIRNSSFGYTNEEVAAVSYASLKNYLEDIHRLVENGILAKEKEFYSPVRLRGGKQISDLCHTGIRYIELRNLDLNPFTSLGIDEDTLRFLHIFLLYMLWTEELETPDEWIMTGNLVNNQIALMHPFQSINLLSEGDRIFREMFEMLDELELVEEKKLVDMYYQQLRAPETTIAGKMWTIIQENSNKELGIIFGSEYQAAILNEPYQLTGFQQMELSTQSFLFDTIQKGIAFEILDEQEQFLKLTHKNHVEYVKNANMTSKDSYIAPLIMQNKTVTKKILADAGFQVPVGEEFISLEQAQQAYLDYENKAFVIKPKTTNYGIGITIFKHGASLADFTLALELAFKEDQVVIIEEFLEGTEYRFFVLDGEVKAILLRIPANVIGDGLHTVEELIIEKNLDPLRGIGHRKPLEAIQLGKLEQLMLKEQALTPISIPKKDQFVYLRKNSNISTGGDSIDVTDEFNESYKKLAVEAVQALGAKICGIDFILSDEKKPINKNSKSYGIIEANFNPAMYMHIYPYKGKGRPLTMEVLKFLYPELNEQ